MHGAIFRALKAHVTEEHGDDAWEEMMDEAGIDAKLYLPVTHYPDYELTALVTAASEVTGRPETHIFEGFGERLAPDLLDTFSTYIPSDGGTLDVLAALDEIYEAVQAGSDEVDVPDVDPERVDDDTVLVRYRSERSMCSLGRGIIHGIADHYGDSVHVREQACMHDGADACEIRVELR